jgi:hypothetical protein
MPNVSALPARFSLNSFRISAKALSQKPVKTGSGIPMHYQPGCKTPGLATLRESRVNAANTVFTSLSQIRFYDG